MSEINALGCFGNVWIRELKFARAGDEHQGHTHFFDHVTLVAKGAVRCEIDGKVEEFRAPAFISINKDKFHKFTALEDNTVYYCIFALRDRDGQVTDSYSGDVSPYEPKDYLFMRDGVRMKAACSGCPAGCEVVT